MGHGLGASIRCVGIADAVAVSDTPIVELDPVANGLPAKRSLMFVTIRNLGAETLTILGSSTVSDTVPIATLAQNEEWEPHGPIPNDGGTIRLVSTATATTARITYWSVG